MFEETGNLNVNKGPSFSNKANDNNKYNKKCQDFRYLENLLCIIVKIYT